MNKNKHSVWLKDADSEAMSKNCAELAELQIDITGGKGLQAIEVIRQGNVLYVHVNGITVLRICRIGMECTVISNLEPDKTPG